MAEERQRPTQRSPAGSPQRPRDPLAHLVCVGSPPPAPRRDLRRPRRTASAALSSARGDKRVPDAVAECSGERPRGGRGPGGAPQEPDEPCATCLADAWSRGTGGG